jgi:hypothetical protein
MNRQDTKDAKDRKREKSMIRKSLFTLSVLGVLSVLGGSFDCRLFSLEKTLDNTAVFMK